jgi:hypothetical protein
MATVFFDKKGFDKVHNQAVPPPPLPVAEEKEKQKNSLFAGALGIICFQNQHHEEALGKKRIHHHRHEERADQHQQYTRRRRATMLPRSGISSFHHLRQGKV